MVQPELHGGITISVDEHGYVRAKGKDVSEILQGLNKIDTRLKLKYEDFKGGGLFTHDNALAFDKGTSAARINNFIKDAKEGVAIYNKWVNSDSAAVDKQWRNWVTRMKNKQ